MPADGGDQATAGPRRRSPTPPLVHLALVAEWEEAVAAGGPYRRSTIGRSLEEEGFVHCAFAPQVAGVVERYYQGRETDLVVLVLDPARLGAELRVEDLAGSGEAFPHVYGPIPLDAVRSVVPLNRWLASTDAPADGEHRMGAPGG